MHRQLFNGLGAVAGVAGGLSGVVGALGQASPYYANAVKLYQILHGIKKVIDEYQQDGLDEKEIEDVLKRINAAVTDSDAITSQELTNINSILTESALASRLRGSESLSGALPHVEKKLKKRIAGLSPVALRELTTREHGKRILHTYKGVLPDAWPVDHGNPINSATWNQSYRDAPPPKLKRVRVKKAPKVNAAFGDGGKGAHELAAAAIGDPQEILEDTIAPAAKKKRAPAKKTVVAKIYTGPAKK